jgi:4-amino-4-deoxy-L-arabinose transferase-like glycosyltransferase
MLRRHGGLLLLLGALIVIFSQLHLASTLQFVPDEGYETMKAFLFGKGFSLYTQIWDDQPPLFTIILNAAFKLFGPNILTARLTVVAFGLLFFASFHELIRRRSGNLAALLAGFLLLASPVVLEMSVAVMQEVPTFAAALTASLLLFRWTERRGWAWLLASGAVLGVALQIKFTAAMVVPAMLCEIALVDWDRPHLSETHKIPGQSRAQWLKVTARDCCVWALAVLAVFAPLALLCAKGSFVSGWRAHTAGHAVEGFGDPRKLTFSAGILLKHLDCVIAAAFGLVLATRHRRWRQCCFPIVLLLTAIGVHLTHRPWWDYYYLHWAVPLAWLAGLACAKLIETGVRRLSERRFKPSSIQVWQGVAACGFAAFVLARSEGRVEATIKTLRHFQLKDSSMVLAAMEEYAQQTHWAYADKIIFPFHARLPALPELAVVTSKRYWSDQITTAGIIEICEHYHPEQLILPTGASKGPWRTLLERDYKLVCTDAGLELYAAKSLKTP